MATVIELTWWLYQSQSSSIPQFSANIDLIHILLRTISFKIVLIFRKSDKRIF